MKTITAQQAAEGFDDYARLAHAGEEILVTHEGQPWVVLAPAPEASPSRRSVEASTAWPDFEAHWQRHFRQPGGGLTATEILGAEKEDRC